MIGLMLPRRDLACLLLLLGAACQTQCELDAASKLHVQTDRLPQVDVKVDPRVDVEVERTVEVEVERTVCDELDFAVERIVRVPPNPPFHSEPTERVSLRITNHGPTAVKLKSGTDALFLDERRTVLHADLHGSEWFMPLGVPAKGAVVVEIVVPEDAGKAMRTVETKATPDGQPFSECSVVDDLRRGPAATR
jgi:hypothetical protein